MKPIYKSASLLVGVLVAGAVSAQVTFTNQSASLQAISGFSNEDCAVDMNQDGLDDIVRITNSGIYIDYQQAEGGFTPFYQSMPIINPPTWSICAGDIDGNGFTDLLFGNGSRVSFCMANADGTAFTEDARPEYIFSQRSTWRISTTTDILMPLFVTTSTKVTLTATTEMDTWYWISR